MNVYMPTKLAKSITGNKKGTEFLVSVYPHALDWLQLQLMECTQNMPHCPPLGWLSVLECAAYMPHWAGWKIYCGL